MGDENPAAIVEYVRQIGHMDSYDETVDDWDSYSGRLIQFSKPMTLVKIIKSQHCYQSQEVKPIADIEEFNSTRQAT